VTLATINFNQRDFGPEIEKGSVSFVGGFSPLLASSVKEVLLESEENLTSGSRGRLHWVESGNFSFVQCVDVINDLSDIEIITQTIYQELLGLIPELKNQNLIRFWNCVPDINSGDGDAEVYKRFCSGRLSGFENCGFSPSDFPAASALGGHQSILTIHMLTSRVAGRHRGNPLQVHAFDYPREYGRSSPSFARSTEVSIEGRESLLIVSGTASIRGHETLHVDDVAAQTYLSIDNIDVLLRQSEKTINSLISSRVYIRREADLEAIKQIVEERLPTGERVYLQADICRSNLLVELECIAQ
jgi:chorismate lyase/3-hydroxybenzoate synthase